MLCLGLSQAFFEGAVYTFVFMWGPTLLTIKTPTGGLPTGLVFSCFMLAMTMGGKLSSLLLELYFPGGAEGLCVLVYVVAAGSMLVPVYCFEFWPVFCAFLVLEGALGGFNSCGGTMRSRLYPESMQSSIMSVFRLPLNILVVCGTNLSSVAGTNVTDLKFVFKVVVFLHLCALFLHCLLMYCMKNAQKSSQIESVKLKSS